MIILGTPRTDEIESYYMADNEVAWKLHQAGFIPKYKDGDDCIYFKKNPKLIKMLGKMGLNI